MIVTVTTELLLAIEPMDYGKNLQGIITLGLEVSG